ncbi:MAG: restriction endonuclease [Gemmataceae bacterium]|nr:restriction endonuclease [Gemmataceae bacterium]
MADKTWRTYEEVAHYLLDQFAEQFGLDHVAPKQKVPGHESGREIEIDAKGVKEDGVGFFIVECKKHKKRLDTDKLDAMAFRIIDSGADGGIVVSPMGLQAGAAKIATSQNIVSVQLNRDANEFEYVLRFLKNVMIGVRDFIHFQDKATVVKVPAPTQQEGMDPGA